MFKYHSNYLILEGNNLLSLPESSEISLFVPGNSFPLEKKEEVPPIFDTNI